VHELLADAIDLIVLFMLKVEDGDDYPPRSLGRSRCRFLDALLRREQRVCSSMGDYI